MPINVKTVLFPVLIAALSGMADGAAAPVSVNATFSGTNQLNHCYRTKIAVGTMAGEADFVVSGVATAACETAWYIRSDRMPVPSGMGAYALDFEIWADSDWLRAAADETWGCSVLWYDGAGRQIGRRPFLCEFLKGKYTKFRFSGPVPAGAVQAAVKLGTDAPNVPPGEKIRVRRTTLTFVPAGAPVPPEVRADVSPPSVRSVFSSPAHAPEVRYEITDAEGVDWASVKVLELPGRTPLPFTREGDTITVHPASPWTAGAHWLLVSAQDVNGNACAVRKAFLAGDPSPTPRTTLRDDGVTLVDGVPFFPIGIYGVKLHMFNGWSFDRACADLKAAHFNFVHTYSWNLRERADFAAAASRYGLRTWSYAGHVVDGGTWFATTGRFERCVLAWYIGDDTYTNLRPWQLAERDEATRMLDGTRITCQASGVMGGPHRKSHYEDYVNHSDVFMPELYHVLGRSKAGDDACVAMVVRDMKQVFRDLARHGDGKPRAIWPILQFFDGVCWNRYPTHDELYATTFAALIHGGTGVTWFHYAGEKDPARSSRYSGIFRTRDDWCAMTNLTRRISQLAPVLLERTPQQPSVPEVVAGPAQDPFGQPAVTMLLKRHAGAVYALAVNAAPQKVTARLQMPGVAGRVEVLDEGRTVDAANGRFTDDFRRFGVHVYRFKETDR